MLKGAYEQKGARYSFSIPPLRHPFKSQLNISEVAPGILLGKSPGGGGDSAYETGGDARRKFWIKALKETTLGVAQAFFDP